MIMKKMRAFLPEWLLCGVVLAGAAGDARAVDFASEVRPVFERHCVECHGAEKQKASFRLDLKAAALKGGDSGAAIVPGNSADSPLIAHVTAPAGEDHAMPPKGPRLAAAEVARLRAWIDAGAPWPDDLAGRDERLDHWAFQPLRPHENGRNVDDFIREGLAEHGLEMSPEADRRTLIRRVMVDLLGLPPTPEEVEVFVNDASPDAYAALVDRCLSSPHYGERYARHWLDIAHYADTHGFERDKRRDHAWRYRDYVIDAFNDDKPYARFLQEQIAGDVLWPEDADAVAATGFLAAGPWDFVGQVETKSDLLKRAARTLDLDDMVTQVMTCTVGLTVNCARCHDHKLDPISQREYYGLWSVFAGLKRDDRSLSETAEKHYEEQLAALNAARNRIAYEIAQMEGGGLSLADIVGGGNGLGSGAKGSGIDPRSTAVQTRSFGKLGNIQLNRYAAMKTLPLIDGVVIPDGGADGAAKIPVSSTGLTVSGLPRTSGQAWDAIRNGPVASQHSTELGGIDFADEGHSLLGLHANAGITFDLEKIRRQSGQTGLRLTGQAGCFGAEAGSVDAWIFVDGEKRFEKRGLQRGQGLARFDIALPESARFLTLMATDGGNGIGHDQLCFADARLLPDPPPVREPALKARLAALKKELADAESAVARLGPPPKVYAVAAFDPPPVQVLRRGDPESPAGDPVPPLALSALPMLTPELAPADAPEAGRRRALAYWLTDPRNPLTPRVIANRLWHWHFGQGLVTTPSDFGLGGDRPSHPELLDWLAQELLAHDGSLKHLHRRILLSAAYRQQSAVREKPAAVDTANRLLWRQNPRRLEAEAVRDAVLRVSGCLNLERGGPGFEDFEYTDAYAPIYRYITADEPALWRRSIYRYIVRTTPDRFMTTLDCPDPANLTPKRLNTTTALQSLALYNNDFMLRQARHFADRVEREAGADPAARVRRAYELAFARPPDDAEAEKARRFADGNGLFALCRALLNANEFVYVD